MKTFVRRLPQWMEWVVAGVVGLIALAACLALELPPWLSGMWAWYLALSVLPLEYKHLPMGQRRAIFWLFDVLCGMVVGLATVLYGMNAVGVLVIGWPT